MRTINLGRNRKARIWIGNLPDANFHPQEVIEFVVPAFGKSPHEFRSAAIELLVPLGPRAMYGLLGGNFRSDSTSEFRAKVCVSPMDGPLLSDTIATRNEVVRVGLPREYAVGVVRGVDLARDQLPAIPSGSLTINCAAHGAVGSCIVVYKYLAAGLVRLISVANVENSDDEFRMLFPEVFN